MNTNDLISKGIARPDSGRDRTVDAIGKLKPEDAVWPLRLVITGQIRGGKNNMVVTRNGLHLPKPEWAKWRDAAVLQVKAQLPAEFQPFKDPVNVRIDYVSGDKRRRDMPAILDSIFHVLEKAGVVEDDSLLWVSESSRNYDKENPRSDIFFLSISYGLKTPWL